jgi:hypothetical protein
MMGRPSLAWSLVPLAPLVVACAGPSQVSFASTERPMAYGSPQGGPLPPPSPQPSGGIALPDDDVFIEPERPAVGTKQERALVHIHGPEEVCSGVILGPNVVVTAHQCVKGEPVGVTALASHREYRIEIASSKLTWTVRRAKYVVRPACEWNDLDLAVLVLAEPAPWVEPPNVIAAPNTGAKVQALGFGHCAGQTRSLKDRFGVVRSRVSEAVVIDVPLCRGDVGGPVVDGRDGDVFGLISRRDDPEGSPLRTTTIARLDTPQARELIAKARRLAEGAEASSVEAVACR